MKRVTRFLLKKYGEMSGDKKVRIALDLSDVVRKIRKDGEVALKKLNGKRLFFLVYEEFKTILVVAVEEKKAQQKTIDQILKDLDNYKQILLEKLKNQNSI